jgi:amidase
LHAVVETNPEAEYDAKLLDIEHKLSGPRGPLHGIPILLKDNTPTLDGTQITCGSLALIGANPSKEAAVVTALRSAGAVILGKGNLAEWSGFQSTSGCSGWSPRGGQSRGIFYPDRKASGSSGGCAIAVALGLCFAAIGTEVRQSVQEKHCWTS